MNNLIEKYRNKCGSCVNLKLNEPISGGYKCVRLSGVHTINEEKCGWRYEIDEDRDYDMLERNNRSDCYLTTIICEILGLDDNCEILTIMRHFRNDILQKNLKYIGILVEYDMIGPMIANNLKNDENSLWIAKELLEHYIKPIIIYINNRDYDNAIVLYQNMTNLLKENYGIYDTNELVEDYDQSKGGHGRVYKKVRV